MAKVSICLHASEARVLPALQSLERQTHRNFEVILLVSSLQTFDFELLNSIDYPVSVLELEKDCALLSWNQAVRIAEGKYLLFITDAVELRADALELLLKAAVAQAADAVRACTDIRTIRAVPFNGDGVLKRMLPVGPVLQTAAFDKHQESDCALFVRSDSFAALGRLQGSESFFEFLLRAAAWGRKIVQVPEALWQKEHETEPRPQSREFRRLARMVRLLKSSHLSWLCHPIEETMEDLRRLESRPGDYERQLVISLSDGLAETFFSSGERLFLADVRHGFSTLHPLQSLTCTESREGLLLDLSAGSGLIALPRLTAASNRRVVAYLHLAAPHPVAVELFYLGRSSEELKSGRGEEMWLNNGENRALFAIPDNARGGFLGLHLRGSPDRYCLKQLEVRALPLE